MNKYSVTVVGHPDSPEIIQANSIDVIRDCIYFYKTDKEGKGYTAYIYPAHLTIVKRLID